MMTSSDLISDYVAGRLDETSARAVEVRAATNPEIAKSIAAATEIARRVRRRLQSQGASKMIPARLM
jgi:anti-sigma factor RsiW